MKKIDWIKETYFFVLKLAQSAFFGGFVLALLVLFLFFDLPGGEKADWLFVCVFLFQLVMILGKFEKTSEAKVIGIFHIVGTAMEVFKTSGSIGSWSYSHIGMFAIGNVPLFSGFMYASVGSFIARCWRKLQFYFDNYPPFWQTVVLSGLIYANFFTHHYMFDYRNWLFLLAGLVYGKTNIYFKVYKKQWKIPLLLACFLMAVVIYFAENVGTFTSYWVYPNQINGWEMVSVGKLGSWFLLLILSFCLVTFVHKKSLYGNKNK